jgi:hypothetical protein
MNRLPVGWRVMATFAAVLALVLRPMVPLPYSP